MPKNLLKRFLFAPIVASFIVSCVPYKSDYFTSVTSPALEPDHRLYKNVQLTSFAELKRKRRRHLGFMGIWIYTHSLLPQTMGCEIR